MLAGSRIFSPTPPSQLPILSMAAPLNRSRMIESVSNPRAIRSQRAFWLHHRFLAKTISVKPHSSHRKVRLSGAFVELGFIGLDEYTRDMEDGG
jgi:hypothetical protein